MPPSRSGVPLMAVFVAAAALGCTAQRIPRPGALAVQVLPPAVSKPVRFELTAAEWQVVEPYLPDLASAGDHELCKDGIPAFTVELLERPGAPSFAEGHFFHGSDRLIFDVGSGAEEREIGGQARFHDAVVAVVRGRGYPIGGAAR
jgi:hypothetical protein